MKQSQILLVVNKKLPPEDYRVCYALNCDKWHVKLAMPGKTNGLPDGQFEQMLFGEGLGSRDILTFWNLYRYLRANRDSLALVHFFSTKLVLFGPPLARLAGVPSIVTQTGLGRVFNDNRLRYRLLRIVYKVLMRLVARCARKVLFQNRGDMRQVREWLRGGSDRFEYVGSGVRGTPGIDRDYQKSPLRILMVTRLLPSKGVADFLTVASRLRNSDLIFVLVGPSSVGHEDLLDSVKQHAQEEVIEYPGELHGKELSEVYQQSDVFLFTSHGEGMPRVMLEAGIAGLCPVAYSINANQDLIEPGRGFLVPLGDVHAAVERIQRLRNDRGLLERNARCFQRFVHETYSIEAYQERLDRVTDSALSDNEPGEGGR